MLVRTQGPQVLIQELVDTPEGLALDPRNVFAPLGTVRQARAEGGRGAVWRWLSEGRMGERTSRAAAVQAMLGDAGYVEAPDAATIPDLLGGWDGAA